MVYCGKPSRACQVCKKRKIRCDEGRPACHQCVSSKRPCPGYLDQFDLVLRDQTDAVRSRAERKRRREKQQHPPGQMTDWAISAVHHAQPDENAIIDRSVRSLTISPSLTETPEQLALCIFFNGFVILSFHPDGQRGFLECLLPLYNATSPDSLLFNATAAVALTISGGYRKSHFLRRRAVFGKALRMASIAIQDPVASTEDETLMAILLLGFYERMSSAIEASKPSGTHQAGASALIRHRGQQNGKSELSAKLGLAVHAQLVETARLMDSSAMTAPLELPQLGADLPRNTASHLTPISAQVANLRGYADRVFQQPWLHSASRIEPIFHAARKIDTTLQDWAISVPDTWLYHPATRFESPTDEPRETFVYQNQIDMYEDVNIANVWNTYRTNRVVTNRVMLTCLAILSDDDNVIAQSAQQTIQALVDGVCASVPFHLGTKMQDGPRDRVEVHFPERDGWCLSGAQRQACAAFGGLYILEGLTLCMDVEGLREGQAEWIERQMRRISRMYLVGMPTRRSHQHSAAAVGREERVDCAKWNLEDCLVVQSKGVELLL